MKKNELKQGVAYFLSSRGEMEAWRDSYFQVAEQKKHARIYVIFADGEPDSVNYSPSSVWVTHCPTFGAGCEKHKTEEGGFKCGRRKVRLMDIKEEFYPALKRAVDKRKAERADEGRGASLERRQQRIAQRAKQSFEAPIRKQFFEALEIANGGYISSYTRIENLPIGLMKTIGEALKASERAGKAVA